MKRFAILSLLLFPLAALSQTEVSGSQSGVWTSAASPYLVLGEILVPSGQTLTLEPGVEVNFQGHYQFVVNGKLEAIGTEADFIDFTTDNPAVGWGGIRIDSSDISELSYCRIEYGKTSGDYPDIHGGGLALLGSNAIVTGCVFADNDATANGQGMGGAVYAYATGDYGEPLTRFVDCVFLRNHCYGEGGAIKFTGDTNSELINCEFYNNDCGYGGGALCGYGILGTRMEGCVFADNYTMYSNGGAISVLGYGNTFTMANCTLTGNTAVTGEGGAIHIAYTDAYLVNTIVWQNPGMYSDDFFAGWGSLASINYCNMLMPDGGSGSHNIYANPQFADPYNYDFQLQEGSPCIDAGVAYFEDGGMVLVDLAPEDYYGTAPDIGAFEYSSATSSDFGSDLTLRLYRNFPNPFSGQTSILYQLKEECPVTLKVFDVMGREVRTLLRETQSAGKHSHLWDGRGDSGARQSPGVYFLKLQAADRSLSTRLILTR